MKRIIAIVTFVLAIMVGFIAFLVSYNYDKNHFGESLEPYADFSSLTIPMTAEAEGQRFLVNPYNRYQVCRVISRGSGTRKKHYSETKTTGKEIKVSIGDNISVDLFQDPSSTDKVFFTYTEDGDSKYYSLEKLEMYRNLYDTVSEKNGNFVIEEEITEADLKAHSDYAFRFWNEIVSNGAYNAISTYGTADFIDSVSDIESKNDLTNLTRQYKKYGDFSGITDFCCYKTSSFGSAYVMTGVAAFADAWEPFLLVIDSEGKIMTFYHM